MKAQTTKFGKVYLVGSGPGDPELLTQKAYKLISSAQVILYDKLISPEICKLFPESCEAIQVGRRGDGLHTEFYDIHPLVIQKAREGKDVVRLKCGDPLIFGRGGEECLVLKSLGISCEIIPGITAAQGAAAVFEIPLTQRKISSLVTYATAHRADGDQSNLVDWSSLPTKGTIVLYMVAKHLKQNLMRLVDNGFPAATPAAYIVSATTPCQQMVKGTLADLATKVTFDPALPALVIIGEVVNAVNHSEQVP